MQGGALSLCDSTADPTDTYTSSLLSPSPTSSSSAACRARDASAELAFRTSIAGGKCNARGVVDEDAAVAREQVGVAIMFACVHLCVHLCRCACACVCMYVRMSARVPACLSASLSVSVDCVWVSG
jgi:hypothetical protein